MSTEDVTCCLQACETRKTQRQDDSLQERLLETQATLELVTDRAKDAEVDLNAALEALAVADRVACAALGSKQNAELVSVISACIASFVAAAGFTVYLLF